MKTNVQQPRLKTIVNQLLLQPKINHWVLILGAVFLVSCQSLTRYDQFNEGFWTGKALIKDKINNTSQIINLKINARKQAAVRVDATLTVGTLIASLVVKGNEMSYLSMNDKKLYMGAATVDAVASLIKVPLDPHLLQNILFDLPITQKNWSCKSDDKGYLQECTQVGPDLKITWADRDADRKNVFIEHRNGRVQLHLASFQPKLEARKDIFTLPKIKGFEIINKFN